MRLYLKRNIYTDLSTIGELSIDGVFECYTLEDTCRRVKIEGKTAIPSGAYQIIINHSQRFNRDLPLLLNVPNFEGIRIHPGNTDKDTHGCILVGQAHATDFISNSVAAFDALFPKIKKAIEEDGKLYINISGGMPG